MRIRLSQLRRVIKEEVSRVISESPIFAAAAMTGMKGSSGKDPKLVALKTTSGDHEVLNVDQKTGKMRVRKKGSSAAPFDVSSSDVKQVVEGRGRLAEGHTRITQQEVEAWKRGDWGFVSEGFAEGAKEMTGAEAEAFIASRDPNETVEQDIIDSETGEIYVEKGRTYGSSYLHPERHARKKVPAAMDDSDDDEIISDIGRSKEVHAELTSALEEFASGWEGFSDDMSDVDPQDAAADAALSFFHMYPQWKDWAGSLGMSKVDIQRAAADYAYEAMTKGSV